MIGLAIGVLVACLGIPSFVVTLAFFLGLQGVPLKLIGQGGSVRFNDAVLRGLAIKNIAPHCRLDRCGGHRGGLRGAVAVHATGSQVAQGLQHPPLSARADPDRGPGAVVIGLAVGSEPEPQPQPELPDRGHPAGCSPSSSRC